MAKKYDTNPLDHDVKKIADQNMGAVDEDSATAELPSDISPSATDVQTNALNQPVPESRGPARPTGPSLNNPTSAANPMTRAEMHTPGTGPAYLPPGSGGIGTGGNPQPNYQPNYQQGNQTGYQSGGQPGYQSGYQPGYQPGYNAGYRPGAQNTQYPPPYSPIAPGAGPYAPYGVPRKNKGLGIDPNIEGGLCYFPWIGWIMTIVVLIKEPKTNMFARFHAMQALLLHGVILALGIVLNMLSGAGSVVHEPAMSIFFGVLGGVLKFGAFVGFIILGILALQMKTPKVPWVSDLAEKFSK